ncbi:MAG: hypothetical protein ACRC2K_05235 [Clostridium sp.]
MEDNNILPLIIFTLCAAVNESTRNIKFMMKNHKYFLMKNPKSIVKYDKRILKIKNDIKEITHMLIK